MGFDDPLDALCFMLNLCETVTQKKIRLKYLVPKMAQISPEFTTALARVWRSTATQYLNKTIMHYTRKFLIRHPMRSWVATHKIVYELFYSTGEYDNHGAFQINFHPIQFSPKNPFFPNRGI
jgi:hypothetical protein